MTIHSNTSGAVPFLASPFSLEIIKCFTVLNSDHNRQFHRTHTFCRTICIGDRTCGYNNSCPSYFWWIDLGTSLTNEMTRYSLTHEVVVWYLISLFFLLVIQHEVNSTDNSSSYITTFLAIHIADIEMPHCKKSLNTNSSLMPVQIWHVSRHKHSSIFFRPCPDLYWTFISFPYVS